MDIRVRSGNPTPEEAQVIERAFAQLDAETRAAASQRGGTGNAWALSGRLAAHDAAAGVAGRTGSPRWRG